MLSIFFIYWMILMVVMLMNIPIFTLFERKMLSYIQKRKGPKKVSFMGLLQPMADGVKLLLKKFVLPENNNNYLFFFSPIMAFLIMLMSWFFFCMKDNNQFSMEYSMLIFFCISSLNVFTLIGSGWGSKSKYALLGSLRGAMQVMSYEVALITLKFLPCCLNNSYKFLKFFKKISNYFFLLFPIIFLWVMSMISETKRAPFDFAEGESELVSGFKVEYSSFGFALLFLAEYGKMILVCFITSIIFFPKFLGTKMFLGKLFCFLFVVFRGSFPRWRMDFLMSLGWKIMLPLGFFYIFLVLV